MRPKARSLSATHAAGVGEPSFVPLVWSLGRQIRTRSGNVPLFSNSCELPDEEVRPESVRDLHAPADRLRGEVRPQGFDPGLAAEDDLSRRRVGLAPAGRPIGLPGPGRIRPADRGDGEFAVVPEGLAVPQGVVPDEPGRGVGQGVDLVLSHAVRIASRPPGERPFEVVGAERRRRPLVAVGAQDAAAVGVVEEDELGGQLVLVRRHASRRRRRGTGRRRPAVMSPSTWS